VVILPFEKPAPERHIGAVWRKTTARHTAIAAVCKLIIERAG
jgi:DNA-binding transcriptional LysR family regulator